MDLLSPEQMSATPSLAAGMTQPQPSVAIQREAPQVSAERAALINRWQKDIEGAKKHWEDDFKRMDESMQLALVGANESWINDDNYVVPVIQRFVNLAVASLYAKNPTPQAKRRKKLMYKLWDGTIKSLQEALANPLDPMAQALITEVDQVQKRNAMIDKIGKTLEALFKYYTGEQEPNFKKLLKQLVRRVKVCGVGYIWLDFQRELEPRPEITAKIEDVTTKIASMERMAADVQDGELYAGEAELEELRLNLQDLQNMESVIVREGPVFDFPRSKDIILDPNTKCVDGLIGTNWAVREYHLTPNEIKDTYKVDVGKKFNTYTPTGAALTDTSSPEDWEKAKACLWIVYDKTKRQSFVMVDGYPDFIQEPSTPRLELEQFWPFIPLVFNQIEHEKRVFPPSDVSLLVHPQREYNNARQGLREHRKQNRPAYAVAKGALEEEDKDRLRNHVSGEVLELTALQPGQDVNTILQAIKHAPIDPNLYDTNSAMEDIYHTVGAQEANFGGSNGTTATESTIAENSRMSTVNSNVDDLDEFLGQVARCFSEICLLELSAETVVEIAGDGAVWPQWSREEIVKEVTLEIKAGSAGRPNQAADLAKMERAIPYLIQFPGINPVPLIEKYATLLDIDAEELIAQGAPSIQALNAMLAKQMGGGMAPPDASAGGSGPNAPENQGQHGGMNAQSTAPNEPGPQPAFPQ